MERLQETDIINMIWDIQLVRYNAVAALAFLLWDVVITWGDEVQYIWPLSPTKWVFLFTRYFGLISQARLVSVNMSLILGSCSVDICRQLYIYQVVFGGVLMACVQAVLMLRAYALYIRDRRVAYAMAALLIAEVGSIPGLICATIPKDIGTICMKTITVRDIVLFVVSTVLPQLLVLGLTVTKFLSGLRAGWGETPVVSRLVRDDIIQVSIILAWVIVSASLTTVKSVYGYIGYYWLLSIIPSLSCRVIINMQRLAGSGHMRERARAEGWSTHQLTTCIFEVLTSPS